MFRKWFLQVDHASYSKDYMLRLCLLVEQNRDYWTNEKLTLTTPNNIQAYVNRLYMWHQAVT